LINVATDLAAAISDSKVLYFLTDSKHLRITLRWMRRTSRQRSSQTGLGRTCEEPGEDVWRALVAGQMFKHGKDEETIYKAAKIKAEGKQ